MCYALSLEFLSIISKYQKWIYSKKVIINIQYSIRKNLRMTRKKSCVYIVPYLNGKSINASEIRNDLFECKLQDPSRWRNRGIVGRWWKISPLPPNRFNLRLMRVFMGSFTLNRCSNYESRILERGQSRSMMHFMIIFDPSE